MITLPFIKMHGLEMTMYMLIVSVRRRRILLLARICPTWRVVFLTVISVSAQMAWS